MNLRMVVYTVAAVWAALIVVSLAVSLGGADATDSPVHGLNRIAAFLMWQGYALVASIVGALLTRVLAARGVSNIKLAGYLPLAVSVFIVGAVVAMIAFRVLVQPAFA